MGKSRPSDEYKADIDSVVDALNIHPATAKVSGNIGSALRAFIDVTVHVKNSAAGLALWRGGEISFGEYATANPKEMEEIIKRFDEKYGNPSTWGTVTKPINSSTPGYENYRDKSKNNSHGSQNTAGACIKLHEECILLHKKTLEECAVFHKKLLAECATFHQKALNALIQVKSEEQSKSRTIEVDTKNCHEKDHDEIRDFNARLLKQEQDSYLDYDYAGWEQGASTDDEKDESSNKGQIQRNLETIKTTGESTAEALDKAFKGWVDNFSWSLDDIRNDADGTFKDIAKSFGKMVAEVILQKEVIEPFKDWFAEIFNPGGSSDSGGGGLFGGLLKSVIGGFTSGATPGFGGGFYGTDTYDLDFAGIGNASTYSMANGGVIGEHVVGVGLSSGQSYQFGENGAELVLPGNSIKQAEKSESGNTNIYIQAVDAQSFSDMVDRNPGAIVNVINNALTGNTALRQTMRSTI